MVQAIQVLRFHLLELEKVSKILYNLKQSIRSDAKTCNIQKTDGNDIDCTESIIFVRRLKFQVFIVSMLQYLNRNPFKKYRD